MKKTIVFVLVAFMMLSCNGNGFKIKGSIEGVANQTIYLMQVVDNELLPIDSAELVNGNFSFTGSVKLPDIYAIEFSQPQERIVFFLDNSDITIDGNLEELSESIIVGSAPHDLLMEFNKMVDEKSQPLMEISFRYQAASMDGILTPSLEAELIAEYEAETDNFVVFIKEFVSKNNHSVVSAYITLVHLSEYVEIDELEQIVTSFPANLQENQFIAALNERIAIDKRTSLGQQFTDFTLANPDGKDISFSSYVGSKYVLLDFWAGWCSPCRIENPHLVNLYNKYNKDGFDIFGVSLDRSMNQWVDAIDKDGLTWTQVSDLSGWESSIAKLYGIASIPANLLISPNGEIIAKNLRGSDLEEKLQELFGY